MNARFQTGKEIFDLNTKMNAVDIHLQRNVECVRVQIKILNCVEIWKCDTFPTFFSLWCIFIEIRLYSRCVRIQHQMLRRDSKKVQHQIQRNWKCMVPEKKLRRFNRNAPQKINKIKSEWERRRNHARITTHLSKQNHIFWRPVYYYCFVSRFITALLLRLLMTKWHDANDEETQEKIARQEKWQRAYPSSKPMLS